MSSLEAVRSVAAQLEEAWNAGNGAAFGAVFAEDADFVTIRGELHQGREAIARGHQSIFDSIYAGSRVEYAVVNAHPARDGVTVAHLRGTLKVPTGPVAGDHTAIATIVLLDREEGPEVAAFHNTKTA